MGGVVDSNVHPGTYNCNLVLIFILIRGSRQDAVLGQKNHKKKCTWGQNANVRRQKLCSLTVRPFKKLVHLIIDLVELTLLNLQLLLVINYQSWDKYFMVTFSQLRSELLWSQKVASAGIWSLFTGTYIYRICGIFMWFFFLSPFSRNNIMTMMNTIHHSCPITSSTIVLRYQ